MKTTRGIGTAHANLAPHASVLYLRGAAPRVAVDTVQMQHVLAQVELLERALASSQQESIAARQQVALLMETNVRLSELAVRHERGVAKTRRFAYHDELADFPNRGLLLTQTDFGLVDGLDADATRRIAQLLTTRSRFRKGDVLYRVGDRFTVLYAIRSGSCKTVLLAEDGQDQVAGYHMAGEIIGMDGIGTDTYECQAIALEDMEVCALSFYEFENLARLSHRFQHNLHRLLSREIARTRTLMIVLGTMHADQRLAVFLLDLSQRYRVRGYSSCEFVLRMTREEIGSYLGLKLETVSRLFSRFQRDGLIQVEGRAVKLLDPVAVNRLLDCGA
jgi:CRP/FNR family transcriptional regulator